MNNLPKTGIAIAKEVDDNLNHLLTSTHISIPTNYNFILAKQFPSNSSHGEILLTPKETSQLIGVGNDTLAVWRSTKRYNLPYIKVGRLVRYRLSDVEAFLNRRTMESAHGK